MTQNSHPNMTNFLTLHIDINIIPTYLVQIPVAQTIDAAELQYAYVIIHQPKLSHRTFETQHMF